MNDSLLIVIAGLGGVFLGMTLLYLAMRLTAWAADWIMRRRAHEQ